MTTPARPSAQARGPLAAALAPPGDGAEAALAMRAAGFLLRVEHHMQELVQRGSGVVAHAARSSVDAGGKRLRPLLVLAASPLLDDGVPAALAAARCDCSMRAAAAVELVHTASLIHDDMLDAAALRRGRPTVVCEHGAEVAIAAGDLLFSLAFRTLADTERCAYDRSDAASDRAVHAVRVLASTARVLAEGEALQSDQAGDAQLPVDAYLERCSRKTGVLFGAAMQLGALFGGAGKRDVVTLGRFGTAVGVAFQVADDVLDCLPADAAESLGKVPGADARDGTMTLPLLLAAGRDPAVARMLTSEAHDTDELLARVSQAGALDDARSHARQLARDAELLLRQLEGRFDVPALREVAARSVDRLS